MADVTFDFERRRRIGLSETVLCTGKSPEQIGEAIAAARGRRMPLLLTRLSVEAQRALSRADRGAIDYDAASCTAILKPWRAPTGPASVALLTAGTSDLPVAHEAARTLAFYGHTTERFTDVGVAGLWRVLQHEEALKAFPVLIVVAGMEGALFSVVGGLAGGVVLAVPTSTGYGAARAGDTALHAALCSCAPGVAVVNIDNGYGAACAAVRVLNQAGVVAAGAPAEAAS